MKDGKFESVDELRAWLDRKPPPREQDLELVTRPPEEWPPLERPLPERRNCNRHSDCDAAEIKTFGKRGYYANFHCHNDECEDCFGK